jgi:formylglycine-generating enzyme required for sulfatase activity
MRRAALALGLALALALTLALAAAAECAAPPALPDPADPARGMVALAGGTFLMGSDAHYAEEAPARAVTVGPFRIDATEVTNAQFAAFVAATGHVTLAERGLAAADFPNIPEDLRAPGSMVFAPPREPVALDDPTRWWRYVRGATWREPLGPGSSIAGFEDHPVVHVAVEDALAYAAWLGRDLPTEAEWEFAARAGASGDGAWDEPFDPVAGWKANSWQGAFPARNTREDGWLTTAPAGCFAPNGFGLHDMTGNVWEYVRDPWTARPAGGPADADRATVKGGSWLCAPVYCARYRPAARQPQERALGSNHIGFRTVLRGG